MGPISRIAMSTRARITRMRMMWLLNDVPLMTGKILSMPFLYLEIMLASMPVAVWPL